MLKGLLKLSLQWAFNKDQYRNYLKDKHSFDDPMLIAGYIKLDLMSVFEESIMNNNEILKGAFNLFKHFNYRRNGELTKDIDVSLIDTTTDKYIETLSEQLKTYKTNIYEYEIFGIKDLKIDVSGYSGKRIRIKSVGRIKDSFHIDVAIEEIDDKEGIDTFEGKKYYSVERTLADKYVTMIQRGTSNTREKDFIDLSMLWEKVNKQLFFEISKKLFINRNIENKDVQEFENIFEDIKYIQKYRLELIITFINSKLMEFKNVSL